MHIHKYEIAETENSIINYYCHCGDEIFCLQSLQNNKIVEIVLPGEPPREAMENIQGAEMGVLIWAEQEFDKQIKSLEKRKEELNNFKF